MSKDSISPYGYDNYPPFTLYQGDDGKWGLIDANGVRLPAVFNRSADGEVFSRVPWETVTFDANEGFELLAWYDPCEVWFNFTWEAKAYPERWAKLLWCKTGRFYDYRQQYADLLPKTDHWIVDAIVMYQTLYRLIDYVDWKREDKEYNLLACELMRRYPELNDVAASNILLAPVLDNHEVDQIAKATLWYSKVELDSFLKENGS